MYPKRDELSKIRTWNHMDFVNLIEYVHELWCYPNFVKKEWKNDKIWGWQYHVTFITGGWSGNEDIIRALLKNTFVELLCYNEWKRGGLHGFIYKPASSGYELVSDYCKKNNISRQAIYKSKHKYSFIQANKRTVFVKRLND
jgi:hypothetical protein